MPRLIMNPDGGAAVEPSSPAARGESAASRAIVVDLADKERKRRMAGETGTQKGVGEAKRRVGEEGTMRTERGMKENAKEKEIK